MPADASIYGLIRPVPITPYVPAEERELQRVRLRSLLGAEEMQRMQLDEARRGMESSRRLQDFFSTNPNATPEQVAPIDYKAAEALRRARLEEESKRATIGKDKAAADKSRIEGMAALARQGRDLIAAATPETLPSILEWGVQNKQQWALKAPPQIMSDPAAFAQWQRQNVLGADEWLKRNVPTISEQQTAATATFTPGPNGPVPNLPVQQFLKEKAAAGRSQINTNILPPQKTFENEDKLRADYSANPMVKSSSELQNAFNLIEAAYKRPSAANDLAMATKYMKILDPTSVVRESEFALAVNATGLLDKVRNYAASVMEGKKLNPAQRKDFYESAKAINDAFQSERAKVDAQYSEMATGYGLNPKNVIPSLRNPKSKQDGWKIERE